MKRVFLCIATAQLLLASFSQAAVIVQLPTAGSTGSIQFTTDVVFNITTAGTTRALAFNNWVTSDGFRDSIDVSPVTPTMGDPALESDVAYTLNSVAGSANIAFFSDNAAFTGGAFTDGDGYLWVDGPSLNPGDIFVIKAATYTMAAGSSTTGFNSQVNQTFTGSMFIADQFNTLLGTSSVPEPGRMSFVLLGILGLLSRRHRVF